MENLIKQLEQYIPFNEQEEKDRQIILDALRTHSDIFERSNKTFHITSSAWVVNKDRTKVLMCFHKIYNSWSWLGGHNDGETDCLKVAIREVQEESGIQSVRPIQNSIYSLEVLTVDGHQKRGQYVSSHLHLNVTYLLEADDTQSLRVKEDENSGVAWFDKDEAISKSSEPWFREHIYSKLNEKLKEQS